MKLMTSLPKTSKEWVFGLIPVEWNFSPLKHTCSRSALYGANIPAESYVPTGVRFIRTTDISEEGHLLEGGVFVAEEHVTNYMLSPGDLLISRSGTLGRAFVYTESNGPCSYAGYLVRFILSDNNIPRFFFYLTKSLAFQGWVQSAAIEATIGNVNGEKYANLCVPVPSLRIQRRIVSYLDAETEQIDKLVAEKERMLALLEEKRAALVNRAVTRGLNPNVPMKPSDIDWLGNIPAHWEVKRLKNVAQELQTGPFGSQLHAEEYTDEGVPVINPADIAGFRINGNKAAKIDEDTAERLSRHRMVPGDVIFARRGELGRSAVVGPEQAGWLCGTGCLRVRLIKDLLEPEFLLLVMANTNAGNFLSAESIGSTMENLNTETLGKFFVLVPPLMEQRSIIQHLENEQRDLENFKGTLANSISLLKERRNALITAAVTGQLKPEAMKV